MADVISFCVQFLASCWASSAFQFFWFVFFFIFIFSFIRRIIHI